MKKIITLMLTLVLTLGAVMGLTACNNDKYITVGYTDYPPMNYEQDGELVGFDTELAEKVFTELGYKVRFKLIVWENKYTELNGGSIDCIWNGFTSNGADDGVPRSQSVDFTYNYMQNAQCILRKSTTPAISSNADFNGKSVTFEAGSAGEALALSIAETEGVTVNNTGVVSQMDAITRLNGNNADYAIVDILLAEAIIANYPDLVINTGYDIAVEYYAIGFKLGSDLTAKVNAELEKLGQNGYLTTLATKYKLATSVITDFTSQK